MGNFSKERGAVESNGTAVKEKHNVRDEETFLWSHDQTGHSRRIGERT